jgi:hypothetical protein
VDVLSAVSIVIRALPELRPMREEFASTFRTFDLGEFDKLEKYTLALSHANTLHQSTLPNKASIVEMGGDVALLRDQLLSDAMALARHNLVNGERLKECKKANGYRAIAADIFLLVAVFKDRWAQVQNKTPVTLAALHDAGSRAIELVTAAALRDQAPIDAREAALTRQKAYTLFFNAYENARWAVRYLRREKDEAEAIAPSLFVVRGGRKRGLEEEEALAVAADSEVASSVEPSGTILMENNLGVAVPHPFTS